MNQIIQVHESLKSHKPFAADLCLFNGRDHLNREHLNPSVNGDARLRAISWNQHSYPFVSCRLYKSHGVNVGAEKQFDFVFAPDFECSVISRYVADHFQLRIQPQYFPYQIPAMDLLGKYASIAVSGIATACIGFDGGDRIHPIPCFQRLVKFWISDFVPDHYAVLGREAMNSLIIIYQGNYWPGLLQNHGLSGTGLFYFGADDPK